MNAPRSLTGLWILLVTLSPDLRAQEPTAQEAPAIQLQLLDTDVRDALRLVAAQSGINLVISNEVQGMVTLDLDGVSLIETLDAIMRVGGWEYTVNGRIVTVTSRTPSPESGAPPLVVGPDPDLEQEVLVLKLRFVDAERVLPVVEMLLSETGAVSLLKTSDQVAQSTTTATTGAATGATAASSGGNLQIGTPLSSSSKGKAAKSHTLVAVDTADRLRRIQEVVDRIDVKPMQVLIEARFVEVSLNDTEKLGIDWNMIASASGAAAPHTFPFGGATLGSYDPQVDGGSAGGVFPNAPNSVTSPAGAGLFTFGALDFSSLSAVLELMESDTRVEIVSNPRVVVGDRNTAIILVGERYPILSANVSEFGSVTEQLDRYEPIGVQLEVTPAVLSDDEIELIVRPSTSTLGASVTGSTGLSVARINSRQIDTSVTVRDRQTVVLGGLFTTREVEQASRVPFLGDVPVLGKLFEHQSKTTERVDLVVFLTVTLVQEDGLTEEQRTMFEGAARERGDSSLAPERRSPLEYSSTGPQLEGPAANE